MTVLPSALAQELLNTAADALGPRAPSRQNRSLCSPPVDCPEQLTVHINTISPSSQGVNNSCAVMPVTQFEVQLWRCISVSDERGTPPSANQLDAEAAAIMDDGWTLWSGLAAARFNGELFTSISTTCQDIEIGPLRCITASGGTAGWAITLTMKPSA